MNTWFVYMIRCENGSLYTGTTNHVIRRWRKHVSGNGAKYTQAHSPELLAYVEQYPDRSRACKREYEIKQLSKGAKEELVNDNQL